jgi:hypothetical protein
VKLISLRIILRMYTDPMVTVVRGEGNRVVTVVQDEQNLITELCTLMQNISAKAIERDNVFKIGLSGYYFQTCHIFWNSYVS